MLEFFQINRRIGLLGLRVWNRWLWWWGVRRDYGDLLWWLLGLNDDWLDNSLLQSLGGGYERGNWGLTGCGWSWVLFLFAPLANPNIAQLPAQHIAQPMTRRTRKAKTRRTTPPMNFLYTRGNELWRNWRLAPAHQGIHRSPYIPCTCQ